MRGKPINIYNVVNVLAVSDKGSFVPNIQDIIFRLSIHLLRWERFKRIWMWHLETFGEQNDVLSRSEL